MRRSWKNAQDWMDCSQECISLIVVALMEECPGWDGCLARPQEMLEDGIGSGRFPTPPEPVSMFGSWLIPELENRLKNQTSE